MARLEFKKMGKNVRIHPLAKILHPEMISIGDNVIIDDFVFLDGKQDTKIGNYVHIASFASITGGGRLVVGDFAGISSGSRIFTGTDDFSGSGLTGPTIPPEYRSVIRSYVEIGKHAVLGANTVVLPGVTIGEGAVTGANSLVIRDVPPWTVNVGSPVRVLRERPRKTILEMEKKLREQYE